jgi:hypothetical protein
MGPRLTWILGLDIVTWWVRWLGEVSPREALVLLDELLTAGVPFGSSKRSYTYLNCLDDPGAAVACSVLGRHLHILILLIHIGSAGDLFLCSSSCLLRTLVDF